MSKIVAASIVLFSLLFFISNGSPIDSPAQRQYLKELMYQRRKQGLTSRINKTKYLGCIRKCQQDFIGCRSSIYRGKRKGKRTKIEMRKAEKSLGICQSIFIGCESICESRYKRF